MSRLCYDNTLYINTMSELPFVFEFHMFVQRKDAKNFDENFDNEFLLSGMTLRIFYTLHCR